MADTTVDVLARNAVPLAVAVGVVGVLLYLKNRSDAGDNVPVFCRASKQGPRTISDVDAAVLVSRIREALYTSFGEDEDAVIDALFVCGTNADVYAVACAFGQWAPILQTDRDLFGAVRAFLSSDDLSTLNNGLASRGISIRF